MADLSTSHIRQAQIDTRCLINDYVYQTVNRWKFNGNFAVISEKNKAFEYMYLGKGKLLQKGNYKIEAINDTVTAELKIENGKYFYSSNHPVLIQLKKGKSKTYPAGQHIEIK